MSRPISDIGGWREDRSKADAASGVKAVGSRTELDQAFAAFNLRLLYAKLVSMKIPHFLLFVAAAATVITTWAAGTDKPVGATQLVNLTLQPVRVSPNPQGAMMLSEATGCYVEYVGKGPAEPVFQFRVGATQKVASVDKCLASLRTQPGVTAVQVVR